VRCTQLTVSYIESIQREVFHRLGIKTSPQVDEDEATEQVFSRKDRKAYRQLWDREAIKQRTEGKRGNKGREAQALGKEGSPKAKTRRTA
jgi:hypothetical protein